MIGWTVLSVYARNNFQVGISFLTLFFIAGDNNSSAQISGPVVFEQYIAIADYKKKNKNDISLTAGDTVDVIEKSDFGKEY